jgi:hypothetical protein
VLYQPALNIIGQLSWCFFLGLSIQFHQMQVPMDDGRFKIFKFIGSLMKNKAQDARSKEGSAGCVECRLSGSYLVK